MQNSELNLRNLLTSTINFSIEGLDGNTVEHAIVLPKELSNDIMEALRANYPEKYRFYRNYCGSAVTQTLKTVLEKGEEGDFVKIGEVAELDKLARMNHIVLDFTTTFKRSKLTGRIMYQKVKFVSLGEYEEECEEVSIPEQEKEPETNQEVDM